MKWSDTSVLTSLRYVFTESLRWVVPLPRHGVARVSPGPKPGGFADSLVSEKVDVHPGLTPGNQVLQTCGWTLCLVHDG